MRDQLADGFLVATVGVGVDQADGDAADPVLDQLADCLEGRFLVDRLDLGTVIAEPAGHFADEMKRHQPLRLHPEERVAVAVGHRLAGDLDHVAEAAGDDQAEAVELVLEHGIGRDGRAVEQHLQVRWRPLQ